MLYAGYYNLSQAEKNNNGASSRRTSQESRASESSTSSSKSKIWLKKALDQLRPTTETLTPAGIYSPIIKQGPLFGSRKSSTISTEVETPKA